MADFSFLSGPSISPDAAQASQDAAAQFDMNAPVPVQVPQAPGIIVPQPPMPGQVPQALLPTAVDPSSVPVANSNASLAPQASAQPQAPGVDTSQYAQPTAPPQQGLVDPNSQDVFQAMGKSVDTQKTANDNIAKAVADKAVAEDAAYKVNETRMNVAAAKQQDFEQKFNQDFSSKMSQLDDISKKLSGSEFSDAKVDSQRFWNSKSTGQQILGGIAIGLGALSSSINGGENGAWKIIQNSIDKDIESQRFNIENKQNNLKTQAALGENMLQNLRAKFGDSLQAETAYRILAADQVQNKIKQLTARTDNTVVQQNASVLNAKLDQEKIQQTQALKMQLALQKKLANGDTSSLSPLEMSQLPENIQKQIVADRELSVPNFQGRATTKENAQKFQEYAAGNKNAQTSLQDALTYSKTYNQASPQERAIMETKVNMLIPGMKDALKLTRLSDFDIDLIKGIVGDPNKIFTLKTTQIAKLNEILKKTKTQLADEADSYGFRPRPQVKIPSLKPYPGQ